MSFTSHTFTSLPLVHTLNPDFLRRQLWLCFLLVRECSRSGSLHAPWFPNSSSNIFPNFADSRSSWLRRFMALSLHEFATSGPSRFKIPSYRASRLRDFESSRVQLAAHSWLWDFVNSRLQIFVSSLPLKTCITNFINPDVPRVKGFPEFPNRTLRPGSVRWTQLWEPLLLSHLTAQERPCIHLVPAHALQAQLQNVWTYFWWDRKNVASPLIKLPPRPPLIALATDAAKHSSSRLANSKLARIPMARRGEVLLMRRFASSSEATSHLNAVFNPESHVGIPT
jgi:hypothetical protein